MKVAHKCCFILLLYLIGYTANLQVRLIFPYSTRKEPPVQSVCNCTHNMQFHTQFAICNCVRQLKRQGKTFFRVLWLDFQNLSRNVMIITTKYKLLCHGYSRCHCQCHQNVRRNYFIIKMDR